MYIEMVEQICDKDKDVRRANLCSMIKRPYRLQEDRRSTNIIIPARAPGRVITVTAHYDVYPKSMGYNDNGSGLATVLSIADSVPDDVEIVFTDNEEVGGWGSQLYLDENEKRVRMNLNVDVVGLGEKIYYESLDPMFELYHEHSMVLDQSYSPVLYSNVPFSDSTIFKINNIPTILVMAGSAPFSRIMNEVWKHQHGNENDGILELLSETGMEKVSNFLLDTLMLNTAQIPQQVKSNYTAYKYKYEARRKIHT